MTTPNNTTTPSTTSDQAVEPAPPCYPFTKSQLCDLMHLVQSDMKSIRAYCDSNADDIPKGVHRSISREIDRLNILDTSVVAAVQLHLDSNSG